METTDNIIAEMCNLARIDEGSNEMVPRKHMSLALSAYANRIEAAVKALIADRDNWRRKALEEDARANEVQSVTNCNQFKIRESLEVAHRTLKLVYENAVEFIQPHLADEIIHVGSAIEAALSAPARNCDFYETESEAYQAYLTAMKNETAKTYVYFEPWLFEKAKGEAK